MFSSASSERRPGALKFFDSFVNIAEKQWQQLAKDSLLQSETDQLWTALRNTIVFNLAPLLFGAVLDRHLSNPFLSCQGLERWQAGGTKLFRSPAGHMKRGRFGGLLLVVEQRSALRKLQQFAGGSGLIGSGDGRPLPMKPSRSYRCLSS
jgi:hypothetical protein